MLATVVRQRDRRRPRERHPVEADPGDTTADLLGWIYLPAAAAVVVVGVTSSDPWLTLDILSRYAIGFPGSLLTGLGFFMYLREERASLELLRVARCFRWGGGAFVVYGFVPEGRTFRVTCSIGLSLFPDDQEDQDTLMKKADIAMYRAKEIGRDNCQLYSADMGARIRQRLALEGDHRAGLEKSGLSMVHRPQGDI